MCSHQLHCLHTHSEAQRTSVLHKYAMLAEALAWRAEERRHDVAAHPPLYAILASSPGAQPVLVNASTSICTARYIHVTFIMTLARAHTEPAPH